MPVFFAMAMMFNACSDDNDLHGETKKATFYLRSSARNYGFTPLLRAMPSGFEEYDGKGTDSDLILYMTQGNEVIQTATFKWDHTYEWHSTVAVETVSPNNLYYVYGYMPADAATASISSTDYSQGSTMVLTNLNTVSTEDVCVITGAATENDPTQSDITTTPTTITPGSFSITAKEGDNYLYVLMNHIYAKLALNFKVEGPPSNFYNLRGIKLKKVEMITGIGQVEVNIHSGSATPTMSYVESTSTTQRITIFDVATDDDNTNDEGILLTPAGYEVPAFFTPMATGAEKDITFISTYDVYHRNSDGSLSDTIVRENCTATNEWKLRAQSGEFGAGKQMTVHATIIPTYLYQLADPDLDNPTIKLQSP